MNVLHEIANFVEARAIKSYSVVHGPLSGTTLYLDREVLTKGEYTAIANATSGLKRDPVQPHDAGGVMITPQGNQLKVIVRGALKRIVPGPVEMFDPDGVADPTL